MRKVEIGVCKCGNGLWWVRCCFLQFFVSFVLCVRVCFASCLLRRNCWSHQNAVYDSALDGVRTRTVRGLLIGSFNGRTCSTNYAFLDPEIDILFFVVLVFWATCDTHELPLVCTVGTNNTTKSSKSTAMACLGMGFDSIPMKSKKSPPPLCHVVHVSLASPIIRNRILMTMNRDDQGTRNHKNWK